MKTSFAKPGAKPGVPAKVAPKAAAPAPRAVPAKPPGKPAPAAASAPAPKKPLPAPAGIRTNVPPRAAASAPAPGPRKPVPAARPAAVEAEPIEVEAEIVEEVQEEVQEELQEELQEEQQEEETSTALEVIDRSEPAVGVENLMNAPLGSVVGELDASDFEIPRLKLMQPMSPLVVEGEFSSGDWVLNNESILWQQECAPIELTIMKLEKKYMEQLAFENEEMPRIFNTAQEAKDAGLVPFGGDGLGYVAIGSALVLIKQPEGVECSAFTHEYGDTLYARALWMLTGMAYKIVGRKIMTQSQIGRLRGGTHTGGFQLEAKLEKGGVAPYWAPILRDGEMHDQNFIEFEESLVGAG